MLLAQRRKMMQYLMRKDIVEFAKVTKALGLTKEASQLRAR
jgi:ribosomal protein S15P/S13E